MIGTNIKDIFKDHLNQNINIIINLENDIENGMRLLCSYISSVVVTYSSEKILIRIHNTVCEYIQQQHNTYTLYHIWSQLHRKNLIIKIFYVFTRSTQLRYTESVVFTTIFSFPILSFYAIAHCLQKHCKYRLLIQFMRCLCFYYLKLLFQITNRFT